MKVSIATKQNKKNPNLHIYVKWVKELRSNVKSSESIGYKAITFIHRRQ